MWLPVRGRTPARSALLLSRRRVRQNVRMDRMLEKHYFDVSFVNEQELVSVLVLSEYMNAIPGVVRSCSQVD